VGVVQLGDDELTQFAATMKLSGVVFCAWVNAEGQVSLMADDALPRLGVVEMLRQIATKVERDELDRERHIRDDDYTTEAVNRTTEDDDA
jgi:hypothetical protein